MSNLGLNIKPLKTEKLKKNNNSVSKVNGGARPNAGRKADPEIKTIQELKEKIELFGLEEVEIKDKLTGVISKKMRTLVLLDVLFNLGCQGNVKASAEWLNRVLGKPKEHVDVDILSFEKIVSRVKEERGGVIPL